MYQDHLSRALTEVLQKMPEIPECLQSVKCVYYTLVGLRYSVIIRESHRQFDFLERPLFQRDSQSEDETDYKCCLLGYIFGREKKLRKPGLNFCLVLPAVVQYFDKIKNFYAQLFPSPRCLPEKNILCLTDDEKTIFQQWGILTEGDPMVPEEIRRVLGLISQLGSESIPTAGPAEAPESFRSMLFSPSSHQPAPQPPASAEPGLAEELAGIVTLRRQIERKVAELGREVKRQSRLLLEARLLWRDVLLREAFARDLQDPQRGLEEVRRELQGILTVVTEEQLRLQSSHRGSRP